MFGWFKPGPNFAPDKARIHIAPGFAFGDPDRVRINLAIDYTSLERVVRNLKGE
jgi:bifunctional pyridoxal-dependent enzyme with beta-cystathionase and maltose regulon repressor activities